MSEEDEPRRTDSIAAAQILARSTRLRLFLVAVWPYIYPVLCVLGGWLLKSFQVEGQFVQVRLQIAAEGKRTREAFRLELGTHKMQEQQHIFAIGRQAAYATGAALGAEPAKAWSTKRKDGDKYMEDYTRLTQRDEPPKDPLTAFNWMFFGDRNDHR